MEFLRKIAKKIKGTPLQPLDETFSDSQANGLSTESCNGENFNADNTNTVEGNTSSHSTSKRNAAVSLPNENLPIVLPDLPQALRHYQRLQELLNRGPRSRRPDLVVIIAGRYFRVHQKELRTNSKYFAERLGFKKNSQCIFRIKSPRVNPDAFQLILDYIYTSKMSLSSQFLQEVHRAAKYLGVDGARRKCLEMFENPTNDIKKVVCLYMTAYNMGLEVPKARALTYLARKYEETVLDSEYLELTKDQLLELLTLAKINARRESNILFLAALKWIYFDIFDREKDAIVLFECIIGYSSMTLEEICSSLHPPLLRKLMNGLLPNNKDSLVRSRSLDRSISKRYSACFRRINLLG